MAQVIQAKCPHCKNVLRVPADWIGRPMRCKHCQQIFQARGRAPVPPAAPARSAQPAVAAPVARPVVVAQPAVPPPAGAAGGSLFSFDDPSAPVTPYRRRRKRSWWKGALVGLCLVGIAVAAVVFGREPLQNYLAKRAASTEKKVARAGGDKRASSTARERPIDDSMPPRGSEKGRPNGGESPGPQTSRTPAPKGTEKTRPMGGDTTRRQPDDLGPLVKTKGPDPKKGPASASGLFPRRALAISVCEYWLANPLGYGRSREANFPGSSTRAVLNALGNFPLRFPNTQLTELSDQGPEPHPPLKEVIEGTITDFVSSSRDQDRIVLLFAGHAAEIDKEAYLVPILGNLKEAKTLIPLRWVYDQLKGCKAREKVLILDVCRYDPARGMERPGSEKMGKILDAVLQAPPAGVQVWSSCIAGQNAYEFESGSVFLQALCATLQERLPGFQEPGNPLPLDVMMPRVNEYLTKVLSSQKLEQTSRLSGKEMDGGAPYNPAAPLPPHLVVREGPVAGNDVASAAEVKKIVDEIAAIPPTRAGRPDVQDGFNVKALPPFPAKVLKEYEPDYRSWKEFETKDEGKKFPLRAAVVKAAKVLEDNASKFRMKEFFGGASTQAVKKAVLKEQAAPGKAILSLKDALEEMQQAGEKRKKEKSKRWQANYDYVMARLKARLVYLYQYDYVLAQIRNDALPPPADGSSGYRLGSLKKVTVPESEVKTWVKDIDRTWAKIVHDYPDTPWALIAQREQLTVLGLAWRPSRD